MKRWLLWCRPSRALRGLAVPGLAVTAFALLAFVIVACSNSQPPAASTNKPVIKMALNDWLGAALDDEVAQILLTEQMHYTDVELIEAGTSDQFPSIASGDLHVSLEVWPSGHPSQIAQYITDAGPGGPTIVDVGTLGPIGQVGWFVPTYLLTSYPELPSWTALQDPAYVTLFATPQTAPNGQFLGGDPTWVQWDQQIITELGLDFTEEWAGSEDGLIADLDTAYTARAPLLFYFYQPHWAFAVYDLTLIQLPTSEASCFPPPNPPVDGGMVACAYPTDHLFKMVWPQLKTYAPDAYEFFQAFGYSTDDQQQMMNDVQNGQTIEQAARGWINTHTAVWQPWIPKGE